MADDIKKRRKRTKTSGRVTPKGTRSADHREGRYTPPQPEYKPSSRWVPITMFFFFGLGVIIILLNYLPGRLLPGSFDSNYYLVGGLVSVCLGFIAATRYR